jgi:hypothetical protein
VARLCGDGLDQYSAGAGLVVGFADEIGNGLRGGFRVGHLHDRCGISIEKTLEPALN